MPADAAALPAPPPADTGRAGWRAWYALLALSLVTLFAFVDRTIFPLLAEPIKHALGLSDLQLGLLQGTGIAVFAVLASYPIGWLSDRYDRRAVLAGCIVVWSGAVVACAMARTFPQILVASAMVGAGEAGLAPIVFSMIPDMFPERKRQLANSIFAVAAGAAGGLAFAVSGMLVSVADALRPVLPGVLQATESWRLAFGLAAAPAPLMILLLATVKLPRRGAPAAPDQAAPPAPPAPPLLPYLRAHRRTIGLFMLGIAVAVFGFGASGAWLAVILVRVFGQTPAQIGAVVAPVTLISTAGSFALSVLIVRRFGARWGDRLPVRALWISYLVAAVGNLSLLLTVGVVQFYVVATIGVTLTAAAGMLYPTGLQAMAPTPLRARVISLQSIASLAAGAAAAPAVGWVSDQFPKQPTALLYAAIGVSTPALVLAALLLRASEAGVDATVADARRLEAPEA